MPKQRPSIIVHSSAFKHYCRIPRRLHTLTESLAAIISAESPRNLEKSNSLTSSPDVLLKTADMMVSPIVPPNGMEIPSRAMTEARCSRKSPMPWSGETMNLRPIPAPAMAMMPNIVGEWPRYSAQDSVAMAIVSMVVPTNKGGNVIRGHLLHTNAHM